MNDFQRVLDSTERHLLSLKHSGVRFVPVEKETLRMLSGPPPRVEVAIAKPPPDIFLPPPLPAPPLAAIEPSHATELKPPALVQDVAAAMESLKNRVMTCVKCPHLVASRKNVVFGVGYIHAQLMFVGEAPGADEDAQGEPFVGVAGQLLTRIIKTMGLSRETVYIANILKCRPDTPGQTFGNRKPASAEMATCKPYVLEQIELIRPKVLVALGATAMEGLMGTTQPIGQFRGNFQNFQGTPLMPTFHPSYIVRTNSLSDKRKVWEDMLKVMEKLPMPISEKQRSYFLNA